MPTFSTIRAAAVLLGIGVCFTALLGRVAYLQTYGRTQTLQQAERQQHQNEVLRARRGTIFDSTGNVLAGTVQTRSVFIDPQFMLQVYQGGGRSLVEMDDALEKLGFLIGQDPWDLTMLISERQNRRFIRIADNIDDRTAEEIQRLRIPGVGLMPVNVRYYPMGSIAAHVLGGVGIDESGEWDLGIEGLELRFNHLLSGRDGMKRSRKDARRRQIAVAADDYLPPSHGQHLILTIDANIQMIAEQELAATCQQFHASRGEAIVMDPRTGDILAMANWPGFNPQNLDDSTQDIRRNRCLTDPFEPGSTIKPFLFGPAIASKVTRADEVWPVPGITWRTDYGRRITDVYHYGPLTTWDGLVKSSNIVSAMIAERMGNRRLHRALVTSGFGQRTGIELPGEDPGLVNPTRNWTKYSPHSIAQGYELLVTPIQLIRAFSVYANGGRLVQPRIVKGVLDADGNVISGEAPAELPMLPEVIDPVTAAEIKRIMSDVPVRGTGTRARSANWNIFGKSGTAHVSTGGSYNESLYTSSFLGGAPAANPRLVVAFIIHEPDRSIAHYGGMVSGPGAGRILERSLAYLQVPSSPQLPLPPQHIAEKLVNFDPRAYRPKSGLTEAQ